MHVLEETGLFPMLAWIGPEYEQITDRSMADLAEAGFNLSLSFVTPERITEQLDCAADHGVRLVVGLPGLRVPGGKIDDGWIRDTRQIVPTIRDHRGLFGYYVADEPKIDRMENIALAYELLRELDPEHLIYVNHWAPSLSWTGYRSYEEMWEEFGRLCRPQFVSTDLYPVRLCDQEDWLAHQGDPCYLPRHKARIEPQYYEMLEVTRQYARQWRVPMWNFTFSRGRYSSETAEGEMRFQLMSALAYGARGLQWFSYAHGGMMMAKDLTPTASWHIAKRLNAEIRTWAPTLLKLRSIGVYHYPANFFYTRPLDQYHLGNPDDLVARGDPVVVGQFLDGEGNEYVLLVNRNPLEPAHVRFGFGIRDGEVVELSPVTGEWSRPWPYRPREMPLDFAPGQGRLFRFRRDIRISEVYGV